VRLAQTPVRARAEKEMTDSQLRKKFQLDKKKRQKKEKRKRVKKS
jgi:hypothetical protein